jgi:hypothetical protein
MAEVKYLQADTPTCILAKKEMPYQTFRKVRSTDCTRNTMPSSYCEELSSKRSVCCHIGKIIGGEPIINRHEQCAILPPSVVRFELRMSVGRDVGYSAVWLYAKLLPWPPTNAHNARCIVHSYEHGQGHWKAERLRVVALR